MTALVAVVLKKTPSPGAAPGGYRSIQPTAMLGGSVRNRVSSPKQQRESLLVPSSQMKPFELMPIAVTGPAGPGNVNPSVCGGDTWSSNSVICVPRLGSKQGACASTETPERIANAIETCRSMVRPGVDETEARRRTLRRETECMVVEADCEGTCIAVTDRCTPP